MIQLSSLNIYYQNVRGLRTKSHDFLSNVLKCNYDIICLSETWLTPNFTDAEYFYHNYNVFRRDRGSGDVRGGGVLIAVRSELCARRRDDLCSAPSAEELWLSIELAPAAAATAAPPRARPTRLRPPVAAGPCAARTLYIACSYFPHGPLHATQLQSFFDSVSNIVEQKNSDSFLLLGDFNISHASWVHGNNTLLSIQVNSDPIATMLSEFMDLTGLQQFNWCTNVNDRILDLIISNSTCVVAPCDSPLTAEDPHHIALDLTFSLDYSIQLVSNDSYKYLFHAADFDNIGKSLSETNWDVLNDMDTETAVTYFYCTLHKLIDKYVPKRKVSVNSRYPPWYSRALVKLIREKLKVHTKWKIYQDPLDYQEFQILRAREKKVESECYTKYINLAEDKITISPKFFWSFIKSKFNSNNIPDHMTYDGETSTDGEAITNMFNDYFHSVFSLPDTNHTTVNIDVVPDTSVVNLSTINVSEELVMKHLRNTDVNKGAGVDEVHPLLINKLAKVLTVPITKLYKKSLSEGCFPNVWKQALITPIFKSGDRHDVRQYRPISKLCIFGKILEKIVTNELNSLLCRHVSPYQHGFLRGRSVDTNLVTYTDFLLNALDSGFQVDAVYTDFSKAFDKINHSTLLRKLLKLGIHGDLLRWLNSYINNRSQAVALKGYTSKFLNITSGIPQGSHLGPFLFTLYINDIESTFVHSCHLLYADDTKIFKIVSSISDCEDLQNDLLKFDHYCKKNQLILNSDKCYIITFSRKHNPISFNYTLSSKIITRVKSIRDLGLTLDDKLNFNIHIDNIISRAYKQLGLILRLSKPFRRPFTFKILYYTFVRSILEFGSVIWNPQYAVHISRIEKIQNKFLKSLDFRTGHCFQDYHTSALRHGLDPLDRRRSYLDASFLYKILHNVIDSSHLLESITFRVKRISSRSNAIFHIPKCNTRYASNSFIRRSCNFYNTHLSDVDIFSDSIYQFKNNIRKLLLVNSCSSRNDS